MNAYKITANEDSMWVVYADSPQRAIDLFVRHWWLSKHTLFNRRNVTAILLAVGFTQPGEGWAAQDDVLLKLVGHPDYINLDERYLRVYTK